MRAYDINKVRRFEEVQILEVSKTLSLEDYIPTIDYI